MALRQAKILPSKEEKRNLTLNFLEAAFVSGSEVDITPVKHYHLTELSGEKFIYDKQINTYVIFDERPKPQLLKTLGWFREDTDQVPVLAYIPTHLLYSKRTHKVVNEVLLQGDDFTALVKEGHSKRFYLKPLEIKRGTLIDIHYDFNKTTENRFYVVDVKTDLVSINYIANLMPYKYDADKEGEDTQNPSNQSHIKFDSEGFGI